MSTTDDGRKDMDSRRGTDAVRREVLKAGAGLLAATALGGSGAALAAAQPRTLLILGGTGFIGPHLTEVALARGWKVSHFNRGKRMPDGMQGVEHLQGDRDGQLEALKGRKWDAVVDNSGYIPRIVKMSADLLAPNAGLYLFVSSISVYADFRRANTEDSAVAKLKDESVEKIDGETYGGLKALCETATRNAFGARTIIVRPGYIVGPLDPTDRFTYWPARATRGGEMLAPGTPQDPVQVVDVRDLVAWMLDLVEQRAFGTYNAVSAPNAFRMGALIDASVRAAANPDTKITWVPAKFLEKQLGEEPDMPPWSPPDGASGGASLTDTTRAQRTGLKIRPLEDTVRDTLAWHRTRPAEKQEKLRAGLDPEKEKTLLAAWHAAKDGARG